MKRLVIAIVFGLIGCVRQNCDMTDDEKIKIVSELKATTQSIFELASKKDLSYNKPMSDNVTAIFSGTVMDSWEAHKQQMVDFFKAQDKIESSIDIIEVNVLSRNSAIVVGNYKIKARDKAGNSFTSPPSCITYVYQRLGNEWKIVHFHDSEQKMTE